MLAIVAVGLLIAFQAAQAPAPSSQPVTGETAQLQQKLLVVKRIYVDSFGDDAVSKQLQGMVVGALVASKRFVVTENKEKADAILRGNALEKTSQEFHALNDKAAVATAAGEHSGSLHGNSSLYGSTVNGTGSISGSGNISEGLWRSDKLARLEPRWRPEYANLIPLALANGVFEADARRVWSIAYSYNRTEITADDVAKLLDALEAAKLLFRWTDPSTQKTWGFWVGVKKTGRLPSQSRLDKKHEAIGPEPPAEELKQFIQTIGQPMASHWLANGRLVLLCYKVDSFSQI